MRKEDAKGPIGRREHPTSCSPCPSHVEPAGLAYTLGVTGWSPRHPLDVVDMPLCADSHGTALVASSRSAVPCLR